MLFPVLDLVLTVRTGQERQAAEMCLAQMKPDQWQILRQFAAEVTSLGESAAAGQRMLVVPAKEMGAEVLKALKVAGQE